MTSVVGNFKGSCHCGALGFSFQTALPVAKWSVRACQCRFCRAHGALTTSDPGGRLMFDIRDVDLLERYRFGLKTADFLLCKRCGVYVGAQIETFHGAFGTINTLTMMPFRTDCRFRHWQTTVLRVPMTELRDARRGGRRLRRSSNNRWRGPRTACVIAPGARTVLCARGA
jgi:hypothetical protein